MLVTQSYSTLCNFMDCSLPGFSVHGTPQVRIQEWVAIPSPVDLPDAGIKPRSPALQADSLPSEPPELPNQPITGSFLAREPKKGLQGWGKTFLPLPYNPLGQQVLGKIKRPE